MTDRFFRIMTNLAVTHSLSNESVAHRSVQLSYLALDAYVRLIALLVKRKCTILTIQCACTLTQIVRAKHVALLWL